MFTSEITYERGNAMATTWQQRENVRFYVEAGESRNTGEWEVETIFSGHDDPNYGADADGNRGMLATFVDDVEIVSIKDPDDNFKEEKDLPEVVKKALDLAIENHDLSNEY